MRRKPIRWTGWAGVPPIFVTLLAIASPAQGQQRTPVGVRFTLGDELYRSELTDAEIAGLEADGASLLAEELGRKIPYLDFRPLDTTAYQMHFLVAKRSATAGADALAQIGLFADLESADPTSRDIYWLTMRRPEDALQPVGTPADILDQLRLKLRLDADYTLLADSLLAHVPVADTAAAWGDPLGWVLPFHGQDLCMDRQ
ncbi:MAG TPA: hypothetical protein VJ997_06975, partial [Longimicrobiales bacterium]|nr:hypothetical protein [Longimicrobiales bacterium]